MKIPAERSVFINCPYDPDFAPRFRAILFATVSCGFIPRSALESGTVAEPRMDRIIEALFSSGFSIHDLSRSQGEGPENFARFNMPLELGIAMARRYMSRGRKNAAHDWLVLIPSHHQHLSYLTDLRAFDLAPYEGTVETIVPKVMSWLAGRPGVSHTPTPRAVLAALPAFLAEMESLEGEWGATEVPWRAVLQAATRCVPPVGQA